MASNALAASDISYPGYGVPNPLNPNGTFAGITSTPTAPTFAGYPPVAASDYPSWLTDPQARGLGTDWVPEAHVNPDPIAIISRDIPPDAAVAAPPVQSGPGATMGAGTPAEGGGGGEGGSSDGGEDMASPDQGEAGDASGGEPDGSDSGSPGGGPGGGTGTPGEAGTPGDSATADAAGPDSGQGGGGTAGSDTGSEGGGPGGGASGDSAGGDSGSGGGGPGGGDAFFKGGIVTKNKLIGPNPHGPDDGFGPLNKGEGVLTAAAVRHYGRGMVAKINKLLVPKEALR